jgi:hypothetical protein
MSKSALPQQWKVPELFRERLGENAGRQRAMAADGHLLVVLHEVPRPDEPERRGRYFWRDAAGDWKASSLGTGSQAIRKHLAEYADAVAELDDQLSSAEKADDYFEILHAAAPLYRAARNMHAALQQARELVPDDRELILLRDLAGEIERGAELLHGDAKNGLDLTVARQAEEQTRRGHEMAVSAHRLNLLVAVFFPIATLSAIFGMNLDHGLDSAGNPLAFWGVLAVGFVGGLLLTSVIASRPAPPSAPPAKPKRKRR